MSISTDYTTPRAAASPTYPKHRITGTRHMGPAWTNAVQVLRAAVNNAVTHASMRPATTANTVNDVGVEILDHILELDAKSLHVLALTFGMLLRASQRD